MAKKTKMPTDVNERAKAIVDFATGIEVVPDPNRAFAIALGLILVIVVSLLSGVATFAVETARFGADYYDGGNRFAVGVGVVFIPMVVLPVALIVFGLLKAWHRPTWIATGCALVPTLCAVGLWNL